MADTKISALPASTTPLTGTETLPIVQSGTTKQVSVANLTAGRTQTSNGIVQGTAGTGYNFTANTPAAGMTSQLLNWYEQGTWTPVFTNLSVVSGTPTYAGTYTRVGRQVFFTIYISGGATTTSTANSTYCNNLPFTASVNGVCAASNASSVDNYGTGLIQGLNVFTPTWTVKQNVVITGTFIV